MVLYTIFSVIMSHNFYGMLFKHENGAVGEL